MTTLFLNPLLIDDAVRRALEEDLGRAGDITTLATIPPSATAKAVIASRKAGVISGLPLAAAAFRIFDPAVRFEPALQDGDRVAPGGVVARISGPAQSVLSAERVALNYMGRMSGIATMTAAFVDRVKHTKARIVCTRKTTPGMRAFEKYAVKCGGGANHRFGLDDAVLIKDNHIAVAGGVTQALRAAKAAVGHLVKIEIEIDRLDQLDAVLAEGADVVLLDNMAPADMATAVARIAGRIRTEASGGVNLDTVQAIAETGVDMISVGALTHSAPVLDLGLDIAISS
ncbi:nicotinate-nucleotide pyrophosphorylase [carboxylating] [Alsobacter metallidurans]|uniref:Probable nicotinate-nucleotide pyrophosphorylase [carboxylating] n=1 Tax=Alsobacter metallidurans TaxID=340221 RepID=A0A917I5T1_9HYPH|nr:carboxylating nicotinate-nucleotide diphosphorylase [Alsobacter metallidurans]GGH17581.1 nicotinate-nucleotide pyrophosphorylase [carboxylating] [Alsobacter metallidurans]